MAGTCSICNRISATGEDHTDCAQLRRIEAEDGHSKDDVLERLGIEGSTEDLGVEIRAVLEHLAREKSGS